MLPAGYRGSEERAAFSTPIGEIDAVVALLLGVTAQARRDRVLRTGNSDTPHP